MSLLTTSDLSVLELPPKVKALAHALEKKHGVVQVSRGGNGLEMRMASPAVLAIEGAEELEKRHLYVNAERFLGIGQWKSKVGTYIADYSGHCVKTGQAFKVSDLLRMPDLEARGYGNRRSSEVNVLNTRRVLIYDEAGNRVPPGPGRVIPIHKLPDDHVAVVYLKSRGYDLMLLDQQFRCGWCEVERPVDRAMGIYWKHLPKGFKRTPQGRIIFFADIEGVCQGYQGRIPEVTSGKAKSYWHPYDNEWVHCESWCEDKKKWVPVPEIERSNLGWDIAKYFTGPNVARSEILLGFDAAIRWNKVFRIDQPVVIVTEGPLDAARWGAPAIAQMGKFLSVRQADLIAQNFARVIYVMDSDSAGRQAAQKVEARFGGRVQIFIVQLPKLKSGTNLKVKDPGDLEDAQAWDLVLPLIWPR